MKKPVNENTGCFNCILAKLVQYDNDPVIAECIHGKFVARYGRRRCDSKDVTNKQKTIEKRKKSWV